MVECILARQVFLSTIIAVVIFQAWASPPTGFVDLREVVPSIVLDIRYAGSHNFVGRQVDGYNAPKCFLTTKTAEAIKEVQKDLSEIGFSLKVYDCYRPQKAVNHFVKWAKDTGGTSTKGEFYPTVDKANLFRNGYIAEKSGHSGRSTADLTVVLLPPREQESYIPGQALHACFLPSEKRLRDNSIDMGTGFDCFHELSCTKTGMIGIQSRININRMFLKTLMERRGFVNYDKECWHYTLKEEPFPDTYFDFPVE